MRLFLGLLAFLGLLLAQEPSAFFTDEAPDFTEQNDSVVVESPDTGFDSSETSETPEARYSDEPQVRQKVLYVSYVEAPERLFKGEVFSVTLKLLSTDEGFDDIVYELSGAQGCEPLATQPQRRKEGRYFFDTFTFVATGSKVRIPDITAVLRFGGMNSDERATLKGRVPETVTLNPPKNYAGVLAENFVITNYKTTRYNHGYNIAVFSAKATRSDVEKLHIKGIEKQGIESIVPSAAESMITYYAVIPKKLEHLTFSYFNLKKERFEEVLIPIIVEDDTVSTQSDLRPTEHKHTRIKILVAAGVAALALVLYVFRRKVLYLLFVVLPALYIAYAAVPIEYACIKPQSPIYLLPMENGTTFEITTERTTLEVQGSIEAFTKVKLKNDKIGWVKNEDLCLR